MKFESMQQVEEYLDHDELECLECGRTFTFLARHVIFTHGLSAAEYRQCHNLPAETPLAGKTYRERHRAKMHRLIAEGIVTHDHLDEAHAKARTAGRGKRASFDLEEQAARASRIPHEVIPAGGTRADGRDALRAREYQREYRKRKRDEKPGEQS
jgi:ROS/MUCR transcriptional regulator protein